MFIFNDYVPANEIWPTAKSYIDEGEKSGLVRGYNIEVSMRDGTKDWLSCSYIYGNPNEYFNDEFHQWMCEEHGWTPTGRISFRGYGVLEYDPEEREEFVRVLE